MAFRRTAQYCEVYRRSCGVNGPGSGRTISLLNGLVDCPELLSSIDICVTRGLRSMTIFRRRLNTTNYSRFSGMSRLMRAGEVASTHLDFFHDSAPSFRRKVIALCDVT
ncbi:hypothetical protein J6590_036367 [Homalodisca vitripennis]|nr:hypothetical protein J6590_036367 [Homalodisca vitripennis]